MSDLASSASGARTELLASTSIGDDLLEWAIAGARIHGERGQAIRHYEGRTVMLRLAPVPDDPEAIERFHAAVEKRAAADPEHFAQLLAAGQHRDRLYLAYELGEARPLSNLLGAGRVPLVQWTPALGGASAGLDEAYVDGLVPYELTPESILVDGPRPGLIADVGIFREVLGRPRRERQRVRPYLAPEVRDGASPDLRSTVYSLGTILHAVNTGTPPSAGANGAGGALVSPLLPAMARVVRKATAPDPAERYDSCASLMDAALEAVHLDHPPEQPPSRLARLLRIAPKTQEPRPAEPRRAPRTRPAAGEPSAARGTRDAVTTRTRGENLVVGGVAVLVAACIVLGAALGSMSGEEEPAKPTPLAAENLEMLVPAGWEVARDAAPQSLGDALVVAPDEGGRGLAIQRAQADAETPAARPVRLGPTEAWREAGLGLGAGFAGVRYVVPTDGDSLVLTCFARRPARAALAECERVASTVRARDAQPIPLTQLAAEREQLANDVERFARRRSNLRERLAGAERQRGQAAVALLLAKLYGREARDLGPAPVSRALESAAISYRRLSNAARAGNRKVWRAVADQVDRRERALRSALAAID